MTVLARHNALTKRSLVGPSYTTALTAGAGSLATPAFTSAVDAVVCGFRFPEGRPSYAGMPPVYGCDPKTTLTYYGDAPAVPPKLDVPGSTVSPLKQSTALANNLGWYGSAVSTANLANGSFSFAFDPSPLGIICGLRDGADPTFAATDPHAVQWGYYLHGDTISIMEYGVVVYTVPPEFVANGVRLGIEFIGDLPVYWLALSGDELPRYNMWSSSKRREANRRMLYARAHLFAYTDSVHTPIFTPYTNASAASSGPAFVASGQSEFMTFYAYGYKNIVNVMQPLLPFAVNAGQLTAASGSARLTLQTLSFVGTAPLLPVPEVMEGNVELAPLLSVGFGRTNATGSALAPTLQNFAAIGGRAGYAAGATQLQNFVAAGGGYSLADTIGLAGLSADGTALSGVVRNVTAGNAPTAQDALQAGRFIVVVFDERGTLLTSAALGTLRDANAISLIISDAALTGSALLLATLYSIIGSTSIDSQAQAAGEVWVINVETGASVRYENFNFNSYAKIGGVYYGARSSGIYELDGDTDAGTAISAVVDMGRMNFNSPMLKRLESAYLSVSSYGTMQLRITDDNGNVYTYDARRSDAAMQQQRIDVGRGLKANYMQFEIINDLGADFELAGAEFVSVDSARRIK